MVRPSLRVSQPMPPPRVSPPTPVWLTTPPVRPARVPAWPRRAGPAVPRRRPRGARPGRRRRRCTAQVDHQLAVGHRAPETLCAPPRTVMPRPSRGPSRSPRRRRRRPAGTPPRRAADPPGRSRCAGLVVIRIRGPAHLAAHLGAQCIQVPALHQRHAMQCLIRVSRRRRRTVKKTAPAPEVPMLRLLAATGTAALLATGVAVATPAAAASLPFTECGTDTPAHVTQHRRHAAPVAGRPARGHHAARHPERTGHRWQLRPTRHLPRAPNCCTTAATSPTWCTSRWRPGSSPPQAGARAGPGPLGQVQPDVDRRRPARRPTDVRQRPLPGRSHAQPSTSSGVSGYQEPSDSPETPDAVGGGCPQGRENAARRRAGGAESAHGTQALCPR